MTSINISRFLQVRLLFDAGSEMEITFWIMLREWIFN